MGLSSAPYKMIQVHHFQRFRYLRKLCEMSHNSEFKKHRWLKAFWDYGAKFKCQLCEIVGRFCVIFMWYLIPKSAHFRWKLSALDTSTQNPQKHRWIKAFLRFLLWPIAPFTYRKTPKKCTWYIGNLPINTEVFAFLSPKTKINFSDRCTFHSKNRNIKKR